jgi:glutamine phosphoribosylpyrophosphate amidotransferase
MSTYGQLVGSRQDAEGIAKIIGADGVCFQSIEALIAATGQTKDQLCLACINGEYPTPCAQKMADVMKQRFLNGYQETSRIYESEEVQA